MKSYRVKFVVVLTQLTVVLARVPAAGDLTPQCVEKNTQTEQTKEHGPAHTARRNRDGLRRRSRLGGSRKAAVKKESETF